MTERPIIFSGPMIRALLAGTKTQTRRIVKPQPEACGADWLAKRSDGPALFLYYWPRGESYAVNSRFVAESCPYGVPGDRLWARESMRRIGAVLDENGRPTSLDIKYEADGHVALAVPFPKRLKGIPEHGQCLAYGGYREASRIALEITGVRVERLQKISEKDARAEGLTFVGDGGTRYGIPGMAATWNNDPRECYRALWESLHGPGSWDENPFVWCVSFRRVEP